MTAHPPKAITLTPEIVERFRAYHRHEQAWGVLHCSLDDGNYCATWGGDRPWEIAERATWTDEERELVRMHDLMNVPQRKRLARRAR